MNNAINLKERIVNDKDIIKNKNIIEEMNDTIKSNYVKNENLVEGVKREEEKEGLEVLYDYVDSLECEKLASINLNIALLVMHSKLFSKVPYKGFGGNFRNVDAFISDSHVKTSEPNKILKDIEKISNNYNELIKLGNIIKNKKEPELYIEYINKAIDLKCRLVEIHPFADGNGRTCRALLNYLLRRVNLVPIYINYEEKDIYIKCMDEALCKNSKVNIRKFYYSKITKSLKDLEKSKKLALTLDKC